MNSVIESHQKYAAYIFAHQDDEFFALPKISADIRSGFEPICIYLTNGQAGRADTKTRDNESLKFLSELGIPGQNVWFVGSEKSISDGELPKSVEQVLGELKSRISGYEIQSLLVPAWEGGHQDHDASHLIGLAVAEHLNIRAHTKQYYLYNGARTWGRFFTVARPVLKKVKIGREVLNFSFLQACQYALTVRYFPSQWRSWVGLFPQALWALLVYRCQILDDVNVCDIRRRPHAGSLLYERMKRMSFAEFMNQVGDFLKYIPAVEPQSVSETNLRHPLFAECSYLFFELTGQAPTNKIFEAYVNLHKHYFLDISQREKKFLSDILTYQVPTEPIELVTRKAFPILGKKINSLIYLMEMDRKYDLYFNDESPTRLKAFVALGILALKLPCLIVYGFILRIRYGFI